MIESFKDRRAQAILEGRNPGKGFPSDLIMIHQARKLADLRRPPNNRLEALRGDRAGQHSIRINDRWRLCFVWTGGDAQDVEIVDYH